MGRVCDDAATATPPPKLAIAAARTVSVVRRCQGTRDLQGVSRVSTEENAFGAGRVTARYGRWPFPGLAGAWSLGGRGFA
jgi:hypothetical protein